MKYSKMRFQNGLRLAVCEMPDVRSVTLGVWVGVGGRFEEDSIAGVSHFLEHMLFKGTQKRTAVQISQAIEGVGGSMNAFTTEETTCFYAKVMAERFHEVLDVLADMVENAAFRPQDVKRERGVILEELRMNRDVPSNYVFELLGELMWPKHPLGRALIGTEETIRSLNRKDFLKFKDENYTASNIVIAVAGKVNFKEVGEAVGKKFSFLKSQKPRLNCLPVLETQKEPEVKIFKKKTEQTHLCIGVRAYHRNHQDRFSLRILNAILGENMSSRLFQVIREKMGLTYDISSSIERFSDTGSLVISAGVTLAHLPKALEGTLKELSKLAKKGVKKKEFEMAKEYCMGQVGLGMEKSSNQMVYIGESELSSGKILDFDELMAEIRAVTVDDIQRVAQDLFVDKKLNLAIVGPVQREKAVKRVFSMS
ncbi:MAG: insulinase family protein [Chlamydiae bacterium]|nr:insulinase family protein [Chlamydiota bacterium]MBI3266011.1 insulinase family protein [Chlamydiota bacterium]